jgi:archaellum component FlaC
MEMAIWNAILTAFLGLLGWSLKDKADEIKRLQILINRTREEMPKEYVTKVDLHTDINRIMDRLDRLENKIDMFMKEQRSALS